MGVIYTLKNGVLEKFLGNITLDSQLNINSNNGVKNSVLTAKFNEINSDLSNKQIKAYTRIMNTAEGGTPAGVTLSISEYNEAIVFITSASNPLYYFNFTLTSDFVNIASQASPDKCIRSGFYNTVSNNGQAGFFINQNAIYGAFMNLNGVSITDLTLTVYYR